LRNGNSKITGSSVLDNNKKLFLRWLNVELSGVCNLECVSCTFKSGIRTSIMTDNTLDKVFREINTVDVKEVPWFSGGEIVTINNKRLREICDQIVSHRNQFSSEWLSQVHTNATIMNEEKADILVNSGAFSWICISADGPNKEFFEANRIRHNKTPFPWEKLLDNIELLLKANSLRKNPIKISFNSMSGGKDYPGADPNFINLLEKYKFANAGYKGSYAPHQWIFGRPEGKPHRCHWQNRQIVIMSNGKYTTCCADLNGDNVFGDIDKMSLVEAMLLPFDKRYSGIGCRTCVQNKPSRNSLVETWAPPPRME
tara:strand:- start:17440 stop:18378 length:939 start_codon:yes stop_codon:yes gene_type:complete